MTKASEMDKPPEPATPRELEAALIDTTLNCATVEEAKNKTWLLLVKHMITRVNYHDHTLKHTLKEVTPND